MVQLILEDTLDLDDALVEVYFATWASGKDLVSLDLADGGFRVK